MFDWALELLGFMEQGPRAGMIPLCLSVRSFRGGAMC